LNQCLTSNTVLHSNFLILKQRDSNHKHGHYSADTHQHYNFGPYQQYYPAFEYPAAGSYPSAYSAQPSAGAAYLTPYSAYPYPAQPYPRNSYSPNSAIFPSFYGGQFNVPSVAPYNGNYSTASPTVILYSSLPNAYQQQSLKHSPSLYISGAAGQ